MKKIWIILVLIFILSLSIRLILATRNIETLVEKCLADDAFYGFSFTRNVARGMGATFDGVTRTNGFPPLFILIMLPIFYFFGNSLELPVHLALILMSVFDVMTGYLIYRILMKISDWRGALVGSCFWLLNPCLMLVTLTGCEASVCTFFDCLCLLIFVRYREGETVRLRRAITLGIAVALAILARSDAIFWAMAIAIGVLADGRESPARRLRRLLTVGCVAGAVISPWVAWNILNFGVIGPVSGLVKAFRSHNLYLQEYGTYFSPGFLLQTWTWIGISFHTIATSLGLGVFLFLLITVAIAIQIIYSSSRRKHPLSEPVIVALIYPTLLICFYSFYFWQTQPWYFHSVTMVFCVCLGYAAGQWIGLLPRRARLVWVPALILIIILSVLRGMRHWRLGLFPWQYNYLQVAKRLHHEFGRDNRFSAFNAGIYRYFSEVPLVNVDASVNNEAYTAMRNKTLFNDYLKERRIRYLVDQEYVVRMYWDLYGPDADMHSFLMPLVNISVPWRFADGKPANIVIYEVNWAP